MAPRRIVTLLVAWLALAASAAPACAALLEGECCPAEACCVDADSVQAMPAAAARTTHDLRADFQTPDTLIHASWPAAAAPVQPAPVDRTYLAPLNARDGRGVYLRTGRLRL
ncbi:MAG: hypothetical protein L0271_04735 [Gemmatimonadetes bacterium]|nr:hypothetical protein [Gemmatimonadota bacterium]